MNKFFKLIKENKLEYFLLFLILLISIFLRFYKIPDSLGFFGDEGRDALIVKRMIIDHKFTLIGPVTSVGNIYLGPLYYYMMIIPMILFNLDPIGAVYMVAVIGVVTVWLVYFLGNKFYNREIGLIAAFLYSISALVVKSSRSSWNPNPMPFFVLLLILSLYYVYIKKKYKWLILTGISFSCALQMHYFALVLLPLIGLVWLLTLRDTLTVNKTSLSELIISTIFFLLTIFIFSLPILIFDFRHDFINFQAIQRFFTERRSNFSIFTTLKNTEGRTQNLFGSLFTIDWQRNLTILFSLAIFIGSIIGIVKKEFRKISIIILSWLIIGILGLATYSGDIYPHYLGFLFPAPFFLIAILIFKIISYPWGKILSLALVSIFVYINLQNTPYKTFLAWNITKVRFLAQAIAQDVNTSQYNVVWLSSVKDYRAMNYRYFLEIIGEKPLEPEDYTDANILYVVVEGEQVNPLDYPIWEIQTFGKAKIEKTFTIKNGPVVYKLIK